MKWFRVFKYADDDGVKTIVMSVAWCKNHSGICLQFAIPLEVMDVESVAELGKQLMKAIGSAYGELIDNDFLPITKCPIVCTTAGGELVLLWSFQGVDDKATRDALKKSNVEQIKYD